MASSGRNRDGRNGVRSSQREKAAGRRSASVKQTAPVQARLAGQHDGKPAMRKNEARPPPEPRPLGCRRRQAQQARFVVSIKRRREIAVQSRQDPLVRIVDQAGPHRRG